MGHIVGACLSQFHGDEDNFELLLAYADGREIGHVVSRRAAERITADFVNATDALAAKDAEIAVLRKALTGLRRYFLTHGWDEKSMMVGNIDQALVGGSDAAL